MSCWFSRLVILEIRSILDYLYYTVETRAIDISVIFERQNVELFYIFIYFFFSFFVIILLITIFFFLNREVFQYFVGIILGGPLLFYWSGYIEIINWFYHYFPANSSCNLSLAELLLVVCHSFHLDYYIFFSIEILMTTIIGDDINYK